jgi:predicted transcriptional regulator
MKMKVSDIVSVLGLKVIAGEDGLGRSITGGYTSDLLSDVIGRAGEGSVWITIQTHHNVVAVASLKDLAAVIITGGLKPTEETLKKSNDENIPVLSSEDDTFTATGRLYELLKKA